jgi:hypothetical protein
MATSKKTFGMITVGAVALAAIAYFGTNYPPDGDDMSGTIAPAERYRANQPTAADVQLGDQTCRPTYS